MKSELTRLWRKEELKENPRRKRYLNKQYPFVENNNEQSLSREEESKSEEQIVTTTKPANYDANEIIEELSDESNYIESPHKLRYESMRFSMTHSKNKSDLPMRPYLKQLLKDVINSDFLYYIADFLNTKLIIKLTAVSTLFRDSFRVYLPTRLQQEADYINLFIETNDELNKEFMKLVDTQIPISNGNWVNFNFIDTLKFISTSITLQDLSDLKFAANNVKENNDMLFAPFWVLFNQKPKRVMKADGKLKEIWKTSAVKTLGDIHFKKNFAMFDKDNIQEEVMLEAFEFLNRATFEESKVSKISSVLWKLISWWRAIVSYHILIHPYRVRNFSTIDESSNLFKFSNYVDQMMDKFYRLKSYLMKIDIMPRDTNFAFNLSHVRLANKEEDWIINKLDINILAEIFTFLPSKEALKLRLINRKWRNAVIEHLDKRLSLFIAEIENLKIYNSDSMFRKLSFFYESGGFFSPHLQMLDYFLHDDLNFISKYHVDELKKIFKPHKIVKQIISAFWALTDVKPKRIGKPNGGVVIDYFSAFQSLIISSNNFFMFLKNINKYAFKIDNIQKSIKYISKIEEQWSIEGISSINQGIFQVYLWIKAWISLHIILNPLNFISNEYVNSSFSIEEVRQIEKMYQCLENWRILYSIKLKCSK